MDMTKLPKAGEIWGHYKGGVYEVVDIAFHTEVVQTFVVYRKVTEDPHVTWCRPLEVWQAMVGDVPRFAFTGKTKTHVSLRPA